MASIPDKSVDLVLTDPPYEVKDAEWHRRWLDEAMRVARLVIFTPGTVNLAMWLSIRKPYWIAAQFKPNSASRILGKMGFYTCWEAILIYGQPYHRPSRDAWNIPVRRQKDVEDFPHPKQVALWVKLIEEFTEKGDKIFDPFCGSGTGAVAALMTGRDFIGCETDPKWAALGLRRLEKLGSKSG